MTPVHSLLALVLLGGSAALVLEPDAALAQCSSIQIIDSQVVTVEGVCPPGPPGEADTGGFISYTPYRWSRSRLFYGDETPSGAPITAGDCERTVAPEPDPNAPPGAPPPEPVTEYGTIWLVVMENVETGEVIAERVSCRFRDQPPPPVPPAPPTPGDVISETAPLLAVEPAHSPTVRGLTGLDTWLWCTGGESVSTPPATLNGWTYVATAARTGVSWDIAGPAVDGAEPAVTSLPGDGCGTEAQPSATWTPEVTGAYTITANGVWTGSYTATMNWEGIVVSIGPIGIGTVTVSDEPVPFDVIESPGVLVSE